MGYKQTHLVINCMFVRLFICLPVSVCECASVCVCVCFCLPAYLCISVYIHIYSRPEGNL